MPDSEKQFYAHSRNNNGTGNPDLLKAHLSGVRNKASCFGTAFGAGALADVAGLLHDMGKYADQFQRRLEHPLTERARDHSMAGAAAILGCYKGLGEMAALAIEGHHIGLKRIRTGANGKHAWGTWLRQISGDLAQNPDAFTEADLSVLLERFQQDNGAFPRLPMAVRPDMLHDEYASAAAMLDVRMLFSALVDADFLDTEAHFNGNAEQPRIHRPEGPQLMIDACLKRLDKYLRWVRSHSPANADIQALRDQLMESCRDMATKPQGLFTLTAPTGAGKTLAMLAFALGHAKKWGLRRIILVMPYLNIIEQTADIYSALFGAEKGLPSNFILEDHSLAHQCGGSSDEDNESESTRVGRLLAENWDAPIILTTSVKCLESLMHNKSAPCRKLHRMAKSVVLFDEVQTLPPRLVVPTLATLSRLAEPHGPYGCTVVFSTATQPAFDHLHESVTQLTPNGWMPREIVCDSEKLFSMATDRIAVRWAYGEAIGMETLANTLCGYDQVMCIVNLKRHAAELANKLQILQLEGVFHLSTNMCPAHRRAVLGTVQACLDSDKPVRLVATQCVEAGVDLDFPIVYRALSPLECLAQAAGRCNRHGSRPAKGQVVIFQLTSDGRSMFPPGYKEGVQATEVFLNNLKLKHGDLSTIDVFNRPSLLSSYYRQLYGLGSRGRGTREDERELWRAVREGDFEKVAHAYRLIEQDAINVLVPFNPEAFRELCRRMTPDEPRDLESVRRWIAEARPYTVSPFRPKRESPLWNVIEPIQFSRHQERMAEGANWFRLLATGEYDGLVGLVYPDGIPMF